ncbi:hypothetical protein ACHAXR_006681, partial [Thalassiosira sp. AJA248-18]
MSGITPHDNDVLFGVGYRVINHPGNQHFRAVVEAKRPVFLEAKRTEKRKIAMRIVDEIHDLDPPGRFLIEDRNNINAKGNAKVWKCVETKKAVDKVMHRIREKEKRAAGAVSKQQHAQLPDSAHIPIPPAFAGGAHSNPHPLPLHASAG